MTNLAVHYFKNEGIYYFSDAPFLSVEEVKSSVYFKIFPNPATNQVTISLTDAIISAQLVSMTDKYF
jgi:hypothetical protein